MSNPMNAAVLVALVLLEAVRARGTEFPPGSTQEFEPAEAERLVRLGAAVPVNDPRAQAMLAGVPVGTSVTKEVLVEKIVERVVEVRALSKEGGKFLQYKNEENLAEFIAGFTDAATLAEFQALEYRRDGGPRKAVLLALDAQYAAAERST